MLDKARVREIATTYSNRVAQVYDPKQIILFGSYVNGNPHEYSDIDIAVVFDGYNGDKLETLTHLIKLRRGLSVDIEPHLLDEKKDKSGFLEHVKETGELIYSA